MRLLTFETAGEQRLGAEWQGRIVDLQNVYALTQLLKYGAAAVADARERLPSDMLAYLQGGSVTRSVARETMSFLGDLPEEVVRNLAGQSALLYREDQVRRRAPIMRPPKIVCVGLNYRDHAIESGMAIPTEPVLFPKYGNTVVGPGDAIVLPPDSTAPDYEAELVFVIGKKGRNISKPRMDGAMMTGLAMTSA